MRVWATEIHNPKAKKGYRHYLKLVIHVPLEEKDERK